jgi:hypothetical protein
MKGQQWMRLVGQEKAVKIVKIENIVKGEKARLKAAVWYDRNEGL